MLTERQSQILHTIIEGYINTATPISSGAVFDTGVFHISCPTIRNEMADLTEQGYLVQPHTSAGRIPTEKGYRFFVDALLSARGEGPKEKFGKPQRHEVRFAVNKVAVRANDIILFIDSSDEIRYVGLQKVLEGPEFETKSSVISLINELERLKHSADKVFEEVDEEIRIFIGSENPFFENPAYSMMLSAFDDGFISFIGPMRMNYRRNLALLDEL